MSDQFSALLEYFHFKCALVHDSKIFHITRMIILWCGLISYCTKFTENMSLCLLLYNKSYLKKLREWQKEWNASVIRINIDLFDNRIIMRDLQFSNP